MLYCPGKGQELLSALGVNLECHTRSVEKNRSVCWRKIRCGKYVRDYSALIDFRLTFCDK